MKSSKHKTSEDMYFDGLIDERYQGFCEDTQQIVKLSNDDGWDGIDEVFEDEEEYWESLSMDDDCWTEMQLFDPNLSDQ